MAGQAVQGFMGAVRRRRQQKVLTQPRMGSGRQTEPQRAQPRPYRGAQTRGGKDRGSIRLRPGDYGVTWVRRR